MAANKGREFSVKEQKKCSLEGQGLSRQVSGAALIRTIQGPWLFLLCSIPLLIGLFGS